MALCFDLTVEDIKTNKDSYTLVDVREPYEREGLEGFIEASLLVPLGAPLTHFLQKADPSSPYVFICQRGYRSAQAADLARQHGLTAYNMVGGMKAWNKAESV